MFHFISKLSISVIFPLLCILVETKLLHNKDIKSICLKWLMLWVIGINAISTGLMQALNPSYTADLLHLTMNDSIVIRELGFSQIGVGIPAVLSYKFKSFRKPIALAYGFYILSCTLIHLTRLTIVTGGEIISLVNDIWIVLVAICIVKAKKSST